MKRDSTLFTARAAALVLVAMQAAACNGDVGAELGAEDRARVAAEAEAAMASFFAASNQQDTDGMLAHYYPGEELVQIACTTVRRGYNSLAPLLRLWHEDQADVELHYDVIRTRPLTRDAAVVAAQGRNQDGQALFWTFVLHRDASGDWRIVQEHQSWPGCREPRRHP